jgi:Uma2 family endonuclease
VLEVVSRSSQRKDLVDHVQDYARAGIPEYWIVDARGTDLVFRVLVVQGGAYADQPVDAGWIRSPLFNRAFRLLRFTNRAGLPDFRLEVTPPR